MKRHLPLLVVLAVLCATAVTAQSNFRLVGTNYIGALTQNANEDWTKGWTNFDPKNTVYGVATDLTTLDGTAATLPAPGKKEITTTLTLDATKVYLLKGFIVVKSGAKLVIPAGTVIRAQADLNATPKNYASIIVERGGQIEVLGTAANPVVMTSNQPVGARERGDWGGLVVCGRATHNLWLAASDAVQLEGFNGVPATIDVTLAKIGGSIPNDNSGIIRYLRLEFGGLAFEANKEINGLTLGAVGSATEINNVQVSFSNDDSFEWFGGSVNSRNLISWKTTDDDFDTDNGYSGISQFGIAVRDSAYYDLTYAAASGASTSEGFESDNEANGTAQTTAFTNAVFSNYTMVGPIPVGTKYADANAVARAAFRRGARIRRNSSQRIVNSIFMGYRNFLMVDGDSSLRNTNNAAVLAAFTPALTTVDVPTKQMMFSNNILVNTTSAYTTAGDTTANGLVEVGRGATLGGGSAGKLAALDSWVRLAANANKIDPVAFTAGTLLVNPVANPATGTVADFRPVAGSPALSGGGFRFAGTPIESLITDSKEIAAAEKFAPIYPNPITNGTLNFGRQVASYGIFDINGKLVAHGFDTDHAPIQGIAAGMYFIKLDGKVQKLIVQ
jgi:Secretion system C-terminal sorting domain